MKLKYTTKKYKLKKAYKGDAGFDLYYHGEKSAVISAGAIRKLGTGICVEIPSAYLGFLAVRSSMGKKGITISNSLGVIDSGYRGELQLQLINNSENIVTIKPGDKIAQLVLLPMPDFEPLEVTELTPSDRGIGGFGSSGS